VTQTCLVTLTLALIFLVSRRDGSPRWVVAGWLALALMFGYMTVDDGAEVHERMGSAFKKVHVAEASSPEPAGLGAKLLKKFPSYTWQILYVPAFGLMGCFVFVFLMTQLRGPGPRIAILVALTCFGLAVAFDFVEGLDRDHPWNLYTLLTERYDLWAFTQETFDEKPFETLRHFSKSVEEFLEMLGMTLFWGVFLSHFMQKAARLRIEFVGAAEFEGSR
jgi:hypothetical protein